MFIAIIGPQCSGKFTVLDYLVAKGFAPVQLISTTTEVAESPHSENDDLYEAASPTNTSFKTSSSSSRALHTLSAAPITANKHRSFLSMSPLLSPTSHSFLPNNNPLRFQTSSALLAHVTRNWQLNFVTTDLRSLELIEPFIRRPFFMLLGLDAPLLQRFRRSQNLSPSSLEEFVLRDDHTIFGVGLPEHLEQSSLQCLNDLVYMRILNAFERIEDFHCHLDALNLLDAAHLRPGWDSYFMTLASLASRRSNCMKRRVGAVLVRENRILATGYNGTARGLANCNEGGCPSCNGTSLSSNIPSECVCLHAEENALLEAGRERVGHNAVLYCNTCPCLRCTVKIIQTGVKTVVYNLTYKVDDASASLFRQAGVVLRRYDPHQTLHLPTSEDHLKALQIFLPEGASDV